MVTFRYRRHNFSQFNTEEKDMDQQAATATTTMARVEQESVWRDRLSRFTASGQSIKAFCAAEAVSAWSFYRWRKLLGMTAGQATSPPKAQPAPFIDLGAMPVAPGLPNHAGAGIDIRLEL